MEALAEIDPGILQRLDHFIGPVLVGIEGQGRRPLARTYVHGLAGPGERKTAEPISRKARGAASAPAYERRMQAMLSDDDWRHGPVMWGGTHQLIERTQNWHAYALDDTAILKQGTHSVGVHNQYAGCAGGLANCQVIVTLSIVQEHVSAPCAGQLFLPQAWCDDPERRVRCHVPLTVSYQPKWQMGLDLIQRIEFEGLPRLPVLGDSLYGDVVEFRSALQERGTPYVLGVDMNTTVWPADLKFVPRRLEGVLGRPPRSLVPERDGRPMNLTQFAQQLPATVWQIVCWRDGSRGPQRGRFAAVRVRPAHGWEVKRGISPDALQPELWLLIHWPKGESKPTKAWFSTLPASTPIEVLIHYGRLRWRIERDYREGKGLLGLDHYEGRSWHGLHHHLALMIVAQQFLATERYAALPEASRPPPPALCTEETVAASAAFPPEPSSTDRQQTPAAYQTKFPHTTATTFMIAAALQAAIARYGLPCCPTCRRENQPLVPIKPHHRKLDELHLYDGRTG